MPAAEKYPAWGDCSAPALPISTRAALIPAVEPNLRSLAATLRSVARLDPALAAPVLSLAGNLHSVERLARSLVALTRPLERPVRSKAGTARSVERIIRSH